MAFCAFDSSVAGFDVTPVENMFITEYMLRAPGDFVKVYLYGLMLCYHHQERMSLAGMARDLDLTEEEVERAFAYWARNGLVRQVGDNPVCYTYMNIKQLTLTSAQEPGEKLYNRAFADEIRRTLGDRLVESAEYQKIYDWIDVLELPEEVVLMLLQHEMKKSRGRFSFRIADKTAREWAQRGVRSISDVEKLVLIDESRKQELKRLLGRLGQRREPSDDEKSLYNKWIDEWGFTAEAVQEACRETTKGVPTMAYLDGILLRQHQLGRHDIAQLAAGMAKEHSERDFARDVFAGLGRTGITPPAEDMAIIEEWRQMGFTQDAILLAVKEVHARGGSSLDDVYAAIEKWKGQGIFTVQSIENERNRIRNLYKELRSIYRIIGIEKKSNPPDANMLSKWKADMHMSEELINLAAEYVRGANSPMLKLDKILSEWCRKGIGTVEAAQAEHEAHLRTSGKPVAAFRTPQDAMQRHTQEERKESYEAAIIDIDEEVF